jgi:hypothetical protein
VTRDEIVTRLGLRYRDTTNRIVLAAEWVTYVDDAFMDVVGSSPFWPFLETQDSSLSITAGTGTATLPTNMTKVTSVYNETDKIPLQPIPGRAEFRHYFPDTDGRGMPLWYRLRNTTIEVYPYPAVTTDLILEGPVSPAVLASGSASPPWPVQYHQIIVLGALSKVYEDDHDDQRAASYQARFDRMLANMKEDLLNVRTESYPPVIDTGI